jgi:COP9 signalosome complex subunit 3
LPIFDVNPQLTFVTPRTYMLYYYYGGMIWIGLKKWQKAHEFLTAATTIPSIALSAILVEAYKKYILVSLLLTGKAVSVPKQCSTIVQRQIHRLVTEYEDLAEACARKDGSLSKTVLRNHATYVKDKALGLVQQLQEKYVCQCIQRLTSTYLTLSLMDIASAVGLANAQDAERSLLKMIREKQISAVISQKDGMVSFNDRVTSTTELVCEMEEQLASTECVVRRLEAVDEDIQCTKSYIHKQCLHDPQLRDEIESEARGGKNRVTKMLEGIFKS